MTAPEPTAEHVPGPALARLEGVQQLPLHEQPDVYQAVHTELQNALAAIDDA